jgi:hypothetical protein
LATTSAVDWAILQSFFLLRCLQWLLKRVRIQVAGHFRLQEPRNFFFSERRGARTFGKGLPRTCGRDHTEPHRCGAFGCSGLHPTRRRPSTAHETGAEVANFDRVAAYHHLSRPPPLLENTLHYPRCHRDANLMIRNYHRNNGCLVGSYCPGHHTRCVSRDATAGSSRPPLTIKKRGNEIRCVVQCH